MTFSLGLWAALMASLTWAVGVIAFAPLSKRHPAYIVNLHRILTALPTFLLILLVRGDFLSSFEALSRREALWCATAVMGGFAFGDVLFLLSTKRLGAPASLAIASIYPIFSALAGFFIRHETLSVPRASGILIVIVGTIFVILSGPVHEIPVAAVPRVQDVARPRNRWQSDHLGGVLLALAAALCWSLNTVAVNEAGRTLDVVMLNLVRMLFAVVLCPLIGIGMNGRRSFRLMRWKEFWPVLPFFVVESAIGPLAYVYGLSHSPLAMGAALTSLAPVISVPLAIALGHEKFSLPRTVGVLAVVGGICVMVTA